MASMVVLVDNAATAKNRGDRRCCEHRTKEASCPWRPTVGSKSGTKRKLVWPYNTDLPRFKEKTHICPRPGLTFLVFCGVGKGGTYQGEGCGQTWWFLRLRLCGSWDVNFKRSPLSLFEFCFAEPALCSCFNGHIYIMYLYLYLYLYLYI